MVVAPPRQQGPALTHLQQEKLRAVVERSMHDKVFFAKSFFGLDLEGKQAQAVNLGGQISTKNAGRRFGKSTTTLIEGVHEALTLPHYGRWRGYVTGPSVDQATIYFNEFEEAVGRSALLESVVQLSSAGQVVTRAPFPQISFKNGAKLMGRSTARDGLYLRGKGADWVAITEAAFIKDKVYNEVIRAMVLDRGGRIRLESTPNGENFFKKIYDLGRTLRERAKGYYRSFHASVYDNLRLARDAIEQIKLEVPEFVWNVEYMARFLADQDIVFPWDLLLDLFDEDYQPYKDDLIRPGGRFYIGADLGRVHDYTVITVVDELAVPLRLAYWERFRGRLHTGPGGAVERINEVSRRFNGARVYLDATNESAVAEVTENVEPVVFSQVVRANLLSNLEVTCQQRSIKLPAGWTQLRDEMRFLRRIKRGLSYRIDHPSDGFDDCVISLALALMGVVQGRPTGTRDAVSTVVNSSFYGES